MAHGLNFPPIQMGHRHIVLHMVRMRGVEDDVGVGASPAVNLIQRGPKDTAGGVANEVYLPAGIPFSKEELPGRRLYLLPGRLGQEGKSGQSEQ